MLEEQLERVRGETKGVGETVGRAKEVVERLGREDRGGGVGHGVETDQHREPVSPGSREEEDVEKRIWTVLEREVGRC